MPGACCTRGLVCNVGERCAHEHTGTAEARRHSLRNGLTAYAELSLETNSFCLHRCRLDGSTDPVGSNAPPAAWHQPRMPEPHGFAVRLSAVRPARREPLTGCPAPRPPSAPTLPRPPHPASRSWRSRYAPLVEAGRAEIATDLGRRGRSIYSRGWLDGPNQIESVQQIRFYAQRLFRRDYRPQGNSRWKLEAAEVQPLS